MPPRTGFADRPRPAGAPAGARRARGTPAARARRATRPAPPRLGAPQACPGRALPARSRPHADGRRMRPQVSRQDGARNLLG